MKKLAERLTWARARSGLTQHELAQKTGVAQSTLASWESGARETGRKISIVADALGVDPLWLVDGRGQAVPADADFPEYDPDRIIEKTEHPLISKHTPVSIDTEDQTEMIAIKKVSLTLEAGFPTFEADQDFSDGGFVNLSRQWVEEHGLVPQCLLAIKVRGSSMEPMLFEDDVVVVNIADTKPKSGGIYAVNFNGQAVVKQLVKEGPDWWLNSFNPERQYGRVMVRGGECIVIGKIVHQGARSLIGKL